MHKHGDAVIVTVTSTGGDSATVGDSGKVRDAATVGNTPKGVRTDFSALRQCRLRLGKASEFAFRSACTPFFYGVSAPSEVSRSRKGLLRLLSGVSCELEGTIPRCFHKLKVAGIICWRKVEHTDCLIHTRNAPFDL